MYMTWSVMKRLVILMIASLALARKYHHHPMGKRHPHNASHLGINYTSKLAFLDQYRTLTLNVDTPQPQPSIGVASRFRSGTVANSGVFNVNMFDTELQVSYALDEDSIFLPDAKIKLIRGAWLEDDEEETDGESVTEQRINLDTVTRNFVRGQVVGDSGSTVLGYISNGGLFDGVIETGGGDHYYLEGASKFFADAAGHSFNTVAYRNSDVSVLPEANIGSKGQSKIFCPALGERNWRTPSDDAIEHLLSRVLGTADGSIGTESGGNFNRILIEGGLDDVLPEENSAIDDDNDQDDDMMSLIVDEEASILKTNLSMKIDVCRRVIGTECHLKVLIDRSFYRDYAGSDAQLAVREVGQRIAEADRLFRRVDFNGDGLPDGIGFRIKAVDIVDRNSDNNHQSRSNENQEPEQNSVNFLLRLAQNDFSDVCMGFIFTHQKLVTRRGSILGAAFAGSLQLPTGICSKRIHLRGTGHREASLNSGFVTLKFDDSEQVVPRARSVLVIAHEFGHAFGSLHDDEENIAEGDHRPNIKRAACNPTKWTDKYLMVSSSPIRVGISENNQKFSICSRQAIKRYLNAKGYCLSPSSPTQ